MIESFSDSSEKSLKTLESSLAAELRSDATVAGWPIHIVDRLDVDIDGLDIVITYDEKYAPEIENLEYGTQNEPPKAVFRTFLEKHGDEIQGQIAEWSIDYFVDSDLIP